MIGSFKQVLLFLKMKNNIIINLRTSITAVPNICTIGDQQSQLMALYVAIEAVIVALVYLNERECKLYSKDFS